MSDLLSILSTEKSISFNKLTALLKCSRQQLDAQLITLQQQGIKIEYQAEQLKLIPELPLLDLDYLSQALPLHQLFVERVIPSTNQFLLDHICELEKGSLCLAEYQTAGRGRRGRQWISPFAGQVIMSLYWTFPRHLDLNGLSLAVGMAIAQTLNQIGATDIQLKWPNDILLKQRKLAGILLEIASKNNGLHNIVIGIGINLSLGQQANHIDQPYAELIEILPQLDRNQLIVQLVSHLTQHLQQFEQRGIDHLFQQQWANFDALLGKEVRVISEHHQIIGIEQGIDQRGYLQLLTEQGMQYFNAGEVSLRKI